MFEWMAWAFSNTFGFKAKLTINSARRSPAFQRQLASNCATGRCAKPWTSEHEAGLALDLWVNGWNIKTWSGIYYQWLVNNAHKYGFHNTYQRWINIDGKIVEPRHWRYVWVELATILHERSQTFAEYFYENIEPKK
jgi:LAS superfamily LD-carboxypeptidase LdcB